MRPNLHPNAYVNPYNTLFRNMHEVADVMNRLAQSDTRPSADALVSGAESSAVQNAGETRLAPAERFVKLPVDAWSTNDAYMISAFVPGVNPEDVEIVFEEDQLTIRGSFPQLQAADEKVELVKRELFHGKFERRLTFRQPVNPDAIEATYSQGVLTLNIPKAEVVKPRQIRITAK
ncbi:MAG: Hsp20/alpha crystallin family protein [Caldilineaceae bacterium]